MKQEREKKTTRRNAILVILVCSIIIVGVFSSYAFFQASGVSQNENVSVNSGTLALTFSDGLNSFTGELEFGSSASKTFSIENNGTVEAKARIMWNDLVNTYTEGSLTYNLAYSETEGGPYTEVVVDNMDVPVSSASTKELLAGNLVIPVDKTYYYEITINLNYLNDIDQTADLNALLSTNFIVEESDGKDLLLSGPVGKTMKKLGKIVKEENPNFATNATTDETADGLFSMEDDYGTSYYYRGAVEDNYVKFGTWKESTYIGNVNSSPSNTQEYLTLEECNADTYTYNCRASTSKVGLPMYWRIIRINGDGSVRMIYDGTVPYANTNTSTGRFILGSSSSWNPTNHNDVKYVGYMYGGTNGKSSTKRVNLDEAGYEDSENAIFNETDSNIKKIIETWYSLNLTDLDTKIADVIYCNDRSLSDTPGKWFTREGENRGYGANDTGFGPMSRFLTESGGWNTTNPKPNLKCPNKNDSFTKIDTDKGNGKLKQKIGLITVDEMSIAGETYVSNQNYYLLKTGSSYWTMSPSIFTTVNSNPVSNIFTSNYGVISTYKPTASAYIAPVISLTPEYFQTLIGDGTMGEPFRESTLEP